MDRVYVITANGCTDNSVFGVYDDIKIANVALDAHVLHNMKHLDYEFVGIATVDITPTDDEYVYVLTGLDDTGCNLINVFSTFEEAEIGIVEDVIETEERNNGELIYQPEDYRISTVRVFTRERFGL